MKLEDRLVDAPRLAQLENENKALNEQIKLLVKTEQRYHRSQNQIDRQLAQIHALSDFALQCSGNTVPAKVISDAISMVQTLFFVDDTLMIRIMECSGQWICFPFRRERYGVCALETVRNSRIRWRVIKKLKDASRPFFTDDVADRDDLSELEEFIATISQQQAMATDDNGQKVSTLILPLRATPGEIYAVLILRTKHSSRIPYFLEQPTRSHLPFLQLFGSHIEKALQSAALTRTLQRQRSSLVYNNRRLKQSLDQVGKMEAIGRLAGGVAHDFNNLLTVILGCASVIKRSNESGPSVHENVEDIIHAANRAAKLTRQLLAFSRQQARTLETIDLNEIVSSMAKILRRLIEESVDLDLKLDQTIGAIRADRGQIEQVLLNLVVNARDAMPHGGRIVIETHAASDVSKESAGSCMLSVVDSGIGMNEMTRSRIFEPFFTTKEAGKGTGMGLAMVYGIVQQNDGYIEVASSPGKGSRFDIIFPTSAQRRVQKKSDATDESEPAVGNQTILLVEDEEGIRRLGKRILSGHGYHVLVADDGSRALEIVRSYHSVIDLIITDVVMPQLGGVQLAEQLRVLRPDAKIMYMSGYPGDTLDAQGLSAGGRHYLEKPFTMKSLLRNVRLALGEVEAG